MNRHIIITAYADSGHQITLQQTNQPDEVDAVTLEHMAYRRAVAADTGREILHFVVCYQSEVHVLLNS